MTTLIFFSTFISIFILFIVLIIRLFQHRDLFPAFKLLAIIILSYTSLWILFYFLSSYKPVPPGTDICFDDWCATVTKTERPEILGNDGHILQPHGQFVILHIRMSNHARGIAQKPSEPRISIIDGKGNSWSFSEEGQLALEMERGRQIPIDSRLELHQSLETELVFDIPADVKNLMALIEEGPFITRLLFYENKQVFLL